MSLDPMGTPKADSLAVHLAGYMRLGMRVDTVRNLLKIFTAALILYKRLVAERERELEL